MISSASTVTVASGTGFTRPVFDLHLSLSGACRVGPWTILRRMPQDIRLLDDEQRCSRTDGTRVRCGRSQAGLGRSTRSARRIPPLSTPSWPSSDSPGSRSRRSHGGGGQPYGTYLLVIEELAAAYLALAIGLSVHTLCTFAVNEFGTDEQTISVLTG